MGIANAHTAAIYSSPKYGLQWSWSIKPRHELEAFANRFLTLLKEKPYGPYQATKLVFGSNAADYLARDSMSGISQYPAPCPALRVRNTVRKRSHVDTDDEDLDVLGDGRADKRARM